VGKHGTRIRVRKDEEKKVQQERGIEDISFYFGREREREREREINKNNKTQFP
jgi:hypothetical protein